MHHQLGDYMLFQSTRLREARPSAFFFAHHLNRFNPRACGRRDNDDLYVYVNNVVSIHAPAGGATLWRLSG